MYCPHCGKQLDDSAAYCPHCGVTQPSHPAGGQPDGKPDALAGFDVLAYDVHWRDPALAASPPADLTGYIPAAQTIPPLTPQPPAPPPAAPPKKRRRRRALIAAIIGGVVVVAAVIGAVVWLQSSAAEQARRQAHPLTLNIVAAGYGDQCTKFPVLATGVDLDGDDVEETFFVGADGEGVALPKGAYTLTFPASPLTPDGILYRPPAVEVQLTINRDLEAGQPIDDANLGELVYERATALDETDEMIDAAASWARRDPSQADRVDALERAAREAHSNAVADAAEQERQRREAEAKAEAERAAAEAKRQSQEAANAYANPSAVDFYDAMATLKGQLAAEQPRDALQAYYLDRGWTVPSVVYMLYFERPTTITAPNVDGDPVTATVSAIQVDFDGPTSDQESFQRMMDRHIDDWVAITGSAMFTEGAQTETGLVMTLSALASIKLV